MGKTIAQELFAIAEAQGGTIAGYPRTIAGAVDALTDALAGSDVDSGRTIAEAVAVMGEYIGGGGGATTKVCIQEDSSTTITGRVAYIDGPDNTDVHLVTEFGTETIEDWGDFSTFTAPRGAIIMYQYPEGHEDGGETYIAVAYGNHAAGTGYCFEYGSLGFTAGGDSTMALISLTTIE